MRILIFDTETSGRNPQWNVILQLSYQIVDSNSWTTQKTVNHYFPWPEDKARVSSEAIIINGLTEEVLQEKNLSDRKKALEEFVADKDSCDMLVAHNLEFDKEFILASCREEGVKYANSGWSQSYDTMKRTTKFCQIPKDWGSGYKWPKLTELADCLGINYSHIVLHDSSGDVELTKQCFRQILAEGIYNLPYYTGILANLTLKVECPDNVRIETEDGELVDEKFFKDYYGESKKVFNIVRQKLMKNWAEENEETINNLINIYSKSPRLKTEEDLKAEIETIKPDIYIKKAFEEQPPSKSKIQEELELEAEKQVSSWMFWSIKKKRQEFVEERLEPYYQQQVDAYNLRQAQHEQSEKKAEEEFNLQSKKRCEERKQHLTALIEGKDTESLDKEILCVPDIMSLPFPYHVDAHLAGSAINIYLLLPQPKDLPHLEGVRLASGNYKIKELSDKIRKKNYSDWVLSIAIYVAANYLNVSPRISEVNIEGHVETEDTGNISLYNISFNRTSYSSLNLEEMELDAVLSQFSVTNKMTKDVIAKLFIVKDKEAPPGKTVLPRHLCDPLFSDVARFVVKKHQASGIEIQREFSIGYNRFGRIVDQLEEVGIVGPAKGTAPREVLVSEEQLEDIISKM